MKDFDVRLLAKTKTLTRLNRLRPFLKNVLHLDGDISTIYLTDSTTCNDFCINENVMFRRIQRLYKFNISVEDLRRPIWKLLDILYLNKL